MKTLIGMTAFVKLMRNDSTKDNVRKFWACEKYADFLLQPLTLGIFVPCDEEGNVLSEPENWKNFIEYSDASVPNLKPELYAYHKAKERVLFEGFEICNRLESVKCVANGDFHFSYDYEIKRKATIEDLVKYNLTLTDSALKQIF